MLDAINQIKITYSRIENIETLRSNIEYLLALLEDSEEVFDAGNGRLTADWENIVPPVSEKPKRVGRLIREEA